MDIYYLPTYSGAHLIFAPHYEDPNYEVFSLTKGHHEKMLTSMLEHDEINLHYADILKETSVEDDYNDLIKNERNYHAKWATIDAVLSVGFFASTFFGDIIGPVPGGYAGYRSYKHGKAFMGARKALKETDYIIDPIMTKLEENFKTAESLEDAYKQASTIAFNNGLPEIANLYSKAIS